MSPPVGPTGLPTACDGSDPLTWELGVAVSALRTDVIFDGTRVPIEQTAVTATVGSFPTPRLGWSASATAIIDGRIDGRDLAGGGAVSGTLAWLPMFERPARPFVGATATLGAAVARATADDGSRQTWTAFDLRLGVMVGKTVADRFVPYAAARAFGGPVLWRRMNTRATGGDRTHVSVGAGVIVRLPRQVDVALEIMPLGERTATAGVTIHR